MYFRRHSLYLVTGIMPLGRHERRGSKVRAEHLARENVISQSGHARHRSTPGQRKAQRRGRAPRSHLILDLPHTLLKITKCWSWQAGLHQQERWARWWYPSTGQNACMFTNRNSAQCKISHSQSAVSDVVHLISEIQSDILYQGSLRTGITI